TGAQPAAGTPTALDHGAIGEEMNELDAGGGGGQRLERPQQRPRRRAGAADEHAVAVANAPYRPFGRHRPLAPLGGGTFPARLHAIRLQGGRSSDVADGVPGGVPGSCFEAGRLVAFLRTDGAGTSADRTVKRGRLIVA